MSPTLPCPNVYVALMTVTTGVYIPPKFFSVSILTSFFCLFVYRILDRPYILSNLLFKIKILFGWRRSKGRKKKCSWYKTDSNFKSYSKIVFKKSGLLGQRVTLRVTFWGSTKVCAQHFYRHFGRHRSEDNSLFQRAHNLQYTGRWDKHAYIKSIIII